MCCMKASIGGSVHVDTLNRPSTKAHTILPLDSHWFLGTPSHLTKSPLFVLLQQGESSHVRARGTCDWLALSPRDYLHLIHSGRCTGAKSSACYTLLSVSLILFKHPTRCSLSSVLRSYILWCQFPFFLHTRCHLSYEHSISNIS